MKKLISLPVLGIVLATAFAFTPKLVDSWTLYNGQIVFGTHQQIKDTYCPGPDVRLCAVQINGSDIVLRP